MTYSNGNQNKTAKQLILIITVTTENDYVKIIEIDDTPKGDRR